MISLASLMDFPTTSGHDFDSSTKRPPGAVTSVELIVDLARYKIIQ
jgi:hypothetical protein